MKHNITLVTGGGRSGKSRFALEITQSFHTKVFVATAEAFDPEMTRRIARHQVERGNAFTTIEEPLRLAHVLSGISADTEAVVIDCITVWLGNLMHHKKINDGQYLPVDRLMDALANPPWDVVIVTNEVGLGLIPADAMSRAYRDLAGTVNQKLAARADTVYLVVSGIPLKVK